MGFRERKYKTGDFAYKWRIGQSVRSMYTTIRMYAVQKRSEMQLRYRRIKISIKRATRFTFHRTTSSFRRFPRFLTSTRYQPLSNSLTYPSIISTNHDTTTKANGHSCFSSTRNECVYIYEFETIIGQ